MSNTPLPRHAGSLRQRLMPSARRRSVDAGKRLRPEQAALGKVQLHFEFQQDLMKRIRLAAAEQNLSYSDYVRKIVGLSCPKIQRPRISLSFGASDLEALAERYGISEATPQRLKQRVMDEVNHHLSGD